MNEQEQKQRQAILYQLLCRFPQHIYEHYKEKVSLTGWRHVCSVRNTSFSFGSDNALFYVRFIESHLLKLEVPLSFYFYEEEIQTWFSTFVLALDVHLFGIKNEQLTAHSPITETMLGWIRKMNSYSEHIKIDDWLKVRFHASHTIHFDYDQTATEPMLLLVDREEKQLIHTIQKESDLAFIQAYFLQLEAFNHAAVTCIRESLAKWDLANVNRYNDYIFDIFGNRYVPKFSYTFDTQNNLIFSMIINDETYSFTSVEKFPTAFPREAFDKMVGKYRLKTVFT